MNDRINELRQVRKKLDDEFKKRVQPTSKDDPFCYEAELNDDDDEDEEKYLEEYFKQSEIIRAELQTMKVNVDNLEQIYHKSLGAVETSQKKKLEKECEGIVLDTNNRAQKMRDLIKKLAGDIPVESAEGFSTDERIKKNIQTALLAEFLETMQRYQSLQNNHSEKTRSLIKSQVTINNPNATDADIEKAIQGGSDQIFMVTDRAKAAQDSLNYIQDRHKEILQLEKSLEEVHQLFVDMAVLVEEQSEKINRIAFQVANVKRDIMDATEELRSANKIKRKGCVVA